MYCPNCGTENQDGARFCRNCGTPLIQAAPAHSSPEQEQYGEEPVRDEQRAERPEWQLKETDPGADQKKQSKFPFVLIGIAGGVVAAAVLIVIGLDHHWFSFGGSGGTKEAEAVISYSSGTTEDPAESASSHDAASGSSSKNESRSGETSSLSDTSSSVSDQAEKKQTKSVLSTVTPTPTPAYDPLEGGIHRYELAVEDVTWDQAFQNAISKGGYLAHINSKDEYDAILSQISSENKTNIQFYLGARRDDSGYEYYWVDKNNQFVGDPINTTASWCSGEWLSGEPSFKDGDITEDRIDMFLYQQTGSFVWNDCPNDILGVVGDSFSGKIGYIIEYDS